MKKYRIDTTSFFSEFVKGKKNNFDNLVSVAVSTPSWFKGEIIDELKPLWSMVSGYKTNGDETKYATKYMTLLYKRLDALEMIEKLNNKTLVCFEESGKFCHRHLIIKFLKEYNFNIESRELL